MLATNDRASFLAQRHPGLAKFKPIGERTTAYVCREFACQSPTAS